MEQEQDAAMQGDKSGSCKRRDELRCVIRILSQKEKAKGIAEARS